MIRKLLLASYAATVAMPVWAQTVTAAHTSVTLADAEAEGQDIVVTGSAYRGEVSSGGARIDVPIKDLPLSISVVTKELAQDRQIRNIRELADNVAGVRSRASGSGAFTIDFTIRGLQGLGGSIAAVNGFRVDNFSAGFDPQAVERVEFVKGPASVLYGASGALSGLVNIVTKSPTADDFLVIDVTGGDPTYARATVDGNLRLSDSLESRTNLAITHDTVVNAFRRIDEQFAMQSFRWHPGDVSIIAEGSYFHTTGPSREATARPGFAEFLNIPKTFKTGERWDRNINTGYLARLDVSWRVTPLLTLRQGISYQDYDETDYDVAPYTFDTFETFVAPGILGRSLRDASAGSRVFISQTEARWTVALGPTQHKLLAGYEYTRSTMDGVFGLRAPLPPLDLANPVYGALQPSDVQIDYFANKIRANAFYVQDYIEWGAFKLLLGLRHDNTNSTSEYCFTTTPGCRTDPIVCNVSGAAKKAFSPRAGLAWQPNNRTTAFISWSRSFNPNTGLDRNNNLLPPERGEQYEVGLRQELAEPGKLSLSLSAFEIRRRNIAECDPLIFDCSRQIAIGTQRVRGVEAEIAGKPVPWIDLIGAFTYLDAKVTETDEAVTGIPIGAKLPEAVPYSASLFAKVALDPLGLPEMGVSAGVYYAAKRPGRDYFASFFPPTIGTALAELPASTRLDLGAYWDVSDRFRLQANLTNAFDAKVYEPVNAGFNRTPVRRFTIGGRVTL